MASIYHSLGTYTSLPCGHYDGDHYLTGKCPEELRDLWILATESLPAVRIEAGDRTVWTCAWPELEPSGADRAVRDEDPARIQGEPRPGR